MEKPDISLEKLKELESQTKDKFTKLLINDLMQKLNSGKRNEFYELLDYNRIINLIEKENNRKLLKKSRNLNKNKTAYLLKVSFRGKIKEIRFYGNELLCALSSQIQDQFDLEPMHLYEFKIGKYKYGPECDEWQEIFDHLDGYKLDDAISAGGLKQGDFFGFLYDFGDHLQFKIQIKDIKN
jgi:hypothetical protein